LQFLHPALLAGTLLFAVPLVIHLLNRQRHKRQQWAAMEFLLRAYRKQRRRLRRENLLLLLLRCLIPIVLALAIARPVLRQAQALIGGSSAVHHIAVLDASYSMGLRQDGGQSPFDQGRQMVSRLLDKLQGAREANDRVSLVAASVRPRFLARAELNLNVARNQWLQLQKPEDSAADLGDAMAQVADLVEESTDPEIRIYVLTDMQVRAFGKALAEKAGQGPEFKDTLRDTCEHLLKKPNLRLRFIDVGPMAQRRGSGTADNVQLTGLRVDQPAAVVKKPLSVVATVRNRGTAAVAAQVTLEVDGGEPSRRIVALEPAAEGEAEFEVSFREIGHHRLRALLQNDGLEADDERFAVIDVRDRLHVLVVDGRADDDPLRTNGYVWRRILDPYGGEGPAEATVFDVQVCDTLALLSGQQSPERYDVTVLAEVDRLNQRAADGIKKALAAGKGLLCAFGERTDPQSFNLHLAATADDPMPFRLLGPEGGGKGHASVSTSIELPEHPVLAEFDEEVYREVLTNFPVTGWQAIAEGSLAENAVVPLRLTDARKSPLLVARDYGEGRALFWTSGPGSGYRGDERWNVFDDPMVAFHLLHGMVKWLALPAQDPFHVQVGGALSCTVPARPEGLELTRPDREGAAKVPISEDSRPLASGRYALPPFTQTLWAGFYTIECQLDRETGKEHAALTFAVNVDPEEGDLRYAAHDEVRQALGIEPVLTALPSEDSATAEPERSELGPSLLLACLLFVLGEAAMAHRVSVRRN
jgi:hypothetical protein